MRQTSPASASCWWVRARIGTTGKFKTTHNAGPVGADVGPPASGNFNATMRGSGLDRQFRGTSAIGKFSAAAAACAEL